MDMGNRCSRVAPPLLHRNENGEKQRSFWSFSATPYSETWGYVLSFVHFDSEGIVRVVDPSVTPRTSDVAIVCGNVE